MSVCVCVGEWVSVYVCIGMSVHVHVYGLFEAKVKRYGTVSDVMEGVISRDEVKLSI